MAVYTSLVTNLGRALIANAQAGGGTIYPISVHTGDGILSLGDDPKTFSALKHEIQNYDITSSNALTPFQASFQFLIDSSTVTASYAINELGLFVKLGSSGTPTLIYYAYVAGGGGDTLTPSDTSNAVIDSNFLAIVFSDAVSCIATMTAAVPPALHAISHITGGDDPIPTAKSSASGLVPITPGDATKVLLGSATTAFGTLPVHAPTHKGNSGTDPLPLADTAGSGALHQTDGNTSHVLLGNNTFGDIPLHGGTHTSLGRDPAPIATTAATGLLIPLSGNAAQVLQGNGTWGAGRLPGEVVDYAGAIAPAGWLLCDGQAYSRATFAVLFSVIGTSFGAGDGSTTFNVPDCRGRATVGAGQGTGLTNRLLGAKAGEENHILSAAEMPVHSHGVSDPGHAHAVYDPTHAHAISDPTHAHSVADPKHAHLYQVLDNDVSYPGSYTVSFGPDDINHTIGWDGYIHATDYRATGIGIYGAGTGIGIYAHATGIGIYGAGTGISLQNAGSGGAHNNMQPFITFNRIIRT